MADKDIRFIGFLIGIWTLISLGSCNTVSIDEPDIPAPYPIEDIPRIEIYAGTASASSSNGSTATSGSTASNSTSASTSSFSSSSISSSQNNSLTRGITEPSKLGYCNADRLQIWLYRSTKGANGPGFDDVKYPAFEGVNTFEYLFSSGPFNSEKFQCYQYKFRIASQLKYYGFAIPALAYEERECGLFAYNQSIPNNYLDLFLQLKNNYENYLNEDQNGSNIGGQESEVYVFQTPELFFGYLKFSAIKLGNEGYKETVGVRQDFPSFWLHCPSGCSDLYFDPYLYGKLYRIVSQYNVTFTEIDEETVERVDLFFSNVPVKLNLSGNHGAFYNITALDECFEKDQNAVSVSREQSGVASLGYGQVNADNYIRVASTNQFSKGFAQLSCFLLPSVKGREMCIRVYYKEGALENGKRYEDFPIRPLTDALLRGDDAQVYSGDELKQTKALWSGEDLYIYNSNNHEFYSYANIKVNLCGRFSDIVGKKDQTGLNIELCPTFDEVHNITLK